MIRLLAADLDGTTLNRQRQIPAANIDAVRTAVNAGVLVVLASGRIAPSMRPYADELGLNGCMICSNGAHVVGPAGEELLHLGLNAATARTVLAYAEEKGVHLNLYSRNTLRFLSESPWGEVYKSRVSTVHHELLTLEERETLVPTKMMLIDDPANLPAHMEALSRKLDPQAARLVVSEPEYLEVLSATASKALGLQTLAGALGITREETAAIGDYLNDLEMIQWAGFSAAVANAAPEVAASADVRVCSNEDGGVADFILNHVLQANIPHVP